MEQHYHIDTSNRTVESKALGSGFTVFRAEETAGSSGAKPKNRSKKDQMRQNWVMVEKCGVCQEFDRQAPTLGRNDERASSAAPSRSPRRSTSRQSIRLRVDHSIQKHVHMTIATNKAAQKQSVDCFV